MKFHDGTPFTAKDVKATFDRVLNPENKLTARGNHAKIKSVEVVDAETVRFKTDGPYPLFVERLTAQVMQSEKVIKEKGHEWMQDNPVGTGPYKLQKWSKKQEHLLVRNDDYWGPKPYFKYARIRIIPEQATQIAELISGGVDIIKAVPPDQMDVISKSGQARTATSPILRTALLQLDQAGRAGPNPFQDKRVRQAANMAVDIDSIIKHVINGLGDRTATTINPMAFGFDPASSPTSRTWPRPRSCSPTPASRTGSRSASCATQPIVEPGRDPDVGRHRRRPRQGGDPDQAAHGRGKRPLHEPGPRQQGRPDVRVLVGLLLRLRRRRHPLRRHDVRPAVQLLLQQGARRPGHPGPLHPRQPRSGRRSTPRPRSLLKEDAAYLFKWGLRGVWGISNRIEYEAPRDEIDRMFIVTLRKK